MLSEKINNIEIKENDIKELIKNIENKANELFNQTSSQDKIKLIDEISELRNHYLTLYWCSYFGYLKNIKDKKFLTSEEIFAKYDGLYNNAIYKFYSVLDNLDDKNKLIEKYGLRFFNIANNQKILLSSNGTLFQKEKELRMQYRNLLNSSKISFNGEELSLISLNKYLQDNNPSIRKEAYDKRYNALLNISESLSKIFKELVNVRQKIAESSSFKNYTDYSYIKMNRIDYSQSDLKYFKDAIIKYFVPLREKLKLAQAKRLNEDKLSYYNSSILFSDGNAKSKYDLDGTVAKLNDILTSINKEYGSLFSTMLENCLIDLEERENKSAGGIATYLPDFKYPVFIKRYIDNSANFIALAHEFGHSLQLYLNRDKQLHENRWPTFDICEIHSTTMELLVSESVKDIYEEDTNKHLINHYTNLIELLIRTCAVDEFQTQIYNNPTYTEQDVKDTWKKIYNEYYPSNNYDIEYYNKGIMWQADINRIDNPFYGIDYALATIYALSFYKIYLLDKQKGISIFTNFCKDGGEIAFKEIGQKYELLSPFSEENIASLAEFLSQKIENIIKDI